MSFADIRGQDRPVAMLKSYIAKSRLEGSYLFSGPEGIGKKLVAKTLAKAVNCSEGALDPCDNCASCLKIERNEHPDVYMIDCDTPILIDSQSGNERADSDAIKIGHIRQLQKNIALKPYEGRKKVFIIDAAHNLTAEASNAFLKILEEPVKSSLIILITSKPFLLFKTIISRCRVVKFSGLSREGLKEMIKEDFGLDDESAHFLAYFSEGRPGRALGLKDTDLIREKNRVIDNFALSHRADFENLNIKKREDVRACLNILATWFRDIYLVKAGLSRREVINYDRSEELLKQVNRFTFAELDDIFNSISDSIFYLERNINSRLLLHNLGVRLWKG